MRFSSFVQMMWTLAGYTLSNPYDPAHFHTHFPHHVSWVDIDECNMTWYIENNYLGYADIRYHLSIVKWYIWILLDAKQAMLYSCIYPQLILIYIFRWCSNLYCGAGKLCWSSMQHYPTYLHRSGTLGSFLQEWLNGPYLYVSKDHEKRNYKFWWTSESTC